MHRAPRPRFLAFLIPLCLSLAGLSAAQGTDLGPLEAALRNRLDASPPAEEAGPLGTALERLVAYTGLVSSYTGIDTADLVSAGRAKLDVDRLLDVALEVQASGTADDGIRTSMAALRELLDRFGLEARQGATNLVPLLQEELSANRVLALVALGDQEREDALELWSDDYGQGARRLVRAAFLQHGAAYFAGRQQLVEAERAETDVDPMEPEIPDDAFDPGEGPTASEPFEVLATVMLDSQLETLPELTLAVRAVEDVGSTLARALSRTGAAGGMQMAAPRQVTVGTETLIDVDTSSGSISCPVTVEVPAFTEEELLDMTIPEGEANNPFFGSSMAVDGDYAAIGHPWSPDLADFYDGSRGYVSVRERNAGGFNQWGEVARLEAPELDSLGIDPTGFGSTVAISGTTLVVGAPNQDVPEGLGVNPGYAFVYERSAQGEWGRVAQLGIPNLDPSNPDLSGAAFGRAIALDGDWIVIGAPGFGFSDKEFEDPPGMAFLFQRDQGGDGAWGWSQSLSGSRFSDFFGRSVAIHEGTLVVGTRSEVFVHELEGSTWRFVDFLFGAEDPQDSDFGASLAISGSTVVVGDPRLRFPGFPQSAGAVFVFERVENCDGVPGAVCWLETRRLTAPSRAAFDRFGRSVAITDVVEGTTDAESQMILVGSPGHDHPSGGSEQGSVYVFVRGHAPGCPEPPTFDPPQVPSGGWGLLARRVSTDPTTSGSFGRSLAVTTRGQVPTELIETPGGGMAEFLAEASPTTVFVGQLTGDVGSQIQVMNGIDPVKAGLYFLELEVDPFDRIVELQDGDEGDNVTRSQTPVLFCVPGLDLADLSVESLTLSPVVENSEGVVVPTIRTGSSGIQLQEATLTVEVKMTGQFDGPLSGARLRTWADGISGSEVGEDELSLPPGIAGRLLDERTGLYVDSIELPPMVSGETLNVAFQVRYERPIGGDGLYDTGNGKVVLRAEVLPPTTLTEAGEGAANNTFPALGLLQPRSNYIVFPMGECGVMEVDGERRPALSKTYETQLGNDLFNVSASLEGAIALSADLSAIPGHGLIGPPASGYEAEGGAIGALDAGVDVTIMGFTLDDMIRFRGLVERDPDFTYSPLDFPLGDAPDGYSFAGMDMLNRDPLGGSEILYAVGPYDSIDLATLPPDLNDQIDDSIDNDNVSLEVELCSDGGVTVTLGVSKSRDFPKQEDMNGNPLPCPGGDCPGEKTFYPGGFPVKVRGKATGQIGIDFVLEATDRLKFNVEPNIGLEAEVALELGNCNLTCVGAAGELTIFEDRFRVEAGIGILRNVGTVEHEGQSYQVECLTAGACFAVENEVTLLKGRIYAFAIYPWLRWCHESVLGVDVPYPCGAYQKKSELDIVKWKGIEIPVMPIVEPVDLLECNSFASFPPLAPGADIPLIFNTACSTMPVTSTCDDNLDCE